MHLKHQYKWKYVNIKPCICNSISLVNIFPAQLKFAYKPTKQVIAASFH